MRLLNLVWQKNSLTIAAKIRYQGLFCFHQARMGNLSLPFGRPSCSDWKKIELLLAFWRFSMMSRRFSLHPNKFHCTLTFVLSELNATTLNLNSIFASMLQKHDKYWNSVNKTNQYFYYILKCFFILILSSEILSGHLIKFMRLEVTFQKTWPRMLRIIYLNYTIDSRLPMIKWMRPHNLLVHQTTNQNL